MYDEFTIYTSHLPKNNNERGTVSKFGSPYLFIRHGIKLSRERRGELCL